MNFFKDNMIRVKLTVNVESKSCEPEVISPSLTLPFQVKFNSTKDKDQFITLDQINDFFGNNITCPITSAFLFQDSDEKDLNKTLSRLVSIDTNIYKIKIKNELDTS